MDTSVRYTPKTWKIRNPKFVFGQHHQARSKTRKKARKVTVSTFGSSFLLLVPYEALRVQ
jgi:hypothetical protein